VRVVICIAAGFAFFSGCVMPQHVALTPGRYALMPIAAARRLTDQCSRPAPRIESTWDATTSDVEQLERDIVRLEGRKADGCCLSGFRLRRIDSFFRQYVGIVVDGKRYIYVNAFPINEFENWPKEVPVPDWKTEPILACDGGSGYWGVLYEPRTRRFSDLFFNGVA